MTPSNRTSKREPTDERRRKARRKAQAIRVLSWSGIALTAIVAGFAFSSGEEPAGTTETDAWDLPALDGDGRVALSQFAGKPTVAAFFASWCHICQRELPGFVKLESLVGEKVNFVGINTMNNASSLPFARQTGIGHWPLATDIGLHDGRQLATNFGARGSPTTVLYDAEGNVVDVTLGGMTAQTLAGKLNQFFGVSP
jgi:thiol-disulfide isomerase/thioredoxin